MIRTLDLRGRALSAAELAREIPRPATDVSRATAAAGDLIDDVRTRGTAALLEHAERFDGVRPASLRVSEHELADALARLDPSVRLALEQAIARVRTVSRTQVPQSTRTVLNDGAVVEQRWQAIRRVGLYVPGGKAVYPSSVVMNVVPAQEAGVESIVVTSPAQKEFGGAVHPTVLGAAALLGVTEVYAIGGASAIGALAFGVDDLGLEPVDLITGPGNVFVAAAKRLVRGVVGIDSEAGPTEILIIADAGADPVLIAVDLVSQAEHDELAASVLVTDSADLAERVRRELERLVDATKHSERVRTALGGAQSAIVLVDDDVAAARFSDAYAPEHLELQTADPAHTLGLIHNAGAIFVGAHSPVSLGDYLAGSNHVLPTGGQARFSSGLGVHTFVRPQQVIRYDAEALAEVEPGIRALATAEDLPAHADAVTARLPRS